MELRTRAYPTEARYYCDKCAVFVVPPDPQMVNPQLKYLERVEFDKVTGQIADDSVLTVYTVQDVLNLLHRFRHDFGELKKFFVEAHERTQATVKFFGEMEFQGYSMQSVNMTTRQQTHEFSYKCNNASCKYEMMLPRQYPFVDQVVGRLVRNPDELQHPDEIIRNVMKKHVGSTIVNNPIVQPQPQSAELAEPVKEDLGA